MSDPAAAIVGWPVDHSRSPLIHNHWLKAHGIAGEYRRLAVPPDRIGQLKDLLQQQGLVGCNVTIPHKQAAFALADETDAVARQLGAANTLWFEQDRLVASNSDAAGFLASLDAGAPEWDRPPRPAVVLGAGGAARAVVWAMLQRAIEPVIVLNRTPENAARLADRFDSRVRTGPITEVERHLPAAGVVVNTTSVGMHGATAFDFSLAGLPADAVIVDVVYTPLVTGLLRAGADRGLRTVDGLGMLLHQAVPGFQQWFGHRPVVTPELRALIIADIEASS